MDIKSLVYLEEEEGVKAEKLSKELNLPLYHKNDFNEKSLEKESLYLYFSKEKCEVRKAGSKEKGVCVDFFSSDVKRRTATGSVKNPISRAIGLKGGSNQDLFVLDATAGLGRDSFFLYSLGAKVAGFERNRVIYHLLEKGVENYFNQVNKDKSGLKFFNIDAKEVFSTGGFKNSFLESDDFFGGRKPDVIYLDPMYPPRRRKSAKPKKEMIYLKALAGEDKDAEDLFLSCAEENIKIVVKRPVYAETISPKIKPSHQLETKLVRYDVYNF